MKIQSSALVLVLFILCGCSGGSDGDVGDPCEHDDHCKEELICDDHNGAGSCQPEHEH